MKFPIKKQALFIALIYGQIYLWCGAIFMTILYHLFSFYDEITVTYITEVFYYIIQTAGIFFFSLFIRSNPAIIHKKFPTIVFLVLTFITGTISILSKDSVAVLIFGAFMNLFIGGLTSIFLTRITTDIDAEQRGLSFGIAYAFGSIGTYLLSLCISLTSAYIIYVYAAMMVISVLCIMLLKKNAVFSENFPENINQLSLSDKFLIAVFLLAILLNLINTMGYHFEQENADQINIVFTRAFYALGLLAAGWINDKSRKTGAVCALLTLGFPLICLAFRHDPEFIIFSSIMSYVFLGFLSVYRAVLFTDVAGQDTKKLFLASFGIAGGLIGNAIGTTIGILLESRQTLLACATLLFYIICGFLFFIVYTALYASPKPTLVETETERQERIFREYVAEYGFNGKQTEVLRLLLKGAPNCEIAEELYLAESTVKYHVKNILKATGCKNRGDLIASYNQKNM